MAAMLTDILPGMKRRLPFLLGALWPGLGQLSAGRVRFGTCLCLAALGLADLVMLGLMDPSGALTFAAGPAFLGWGLLWVAGQMDLFLVLVLAPGRRERARRLLKAGIVYLLRGDAARAEEALSRSASLGGGPAASLHMAQAERAAGHGDRASRRLAALAADPGSAAWSWEIARARTESRQR